MSKTTKLITAGTAFLLLMTLAASCTTKTDSAPSPSRQEIHDPAPSDADVAPPPETDDLADAITKLPQSGAVDILWDLLDGYWNNPGNLFVVFARQDGLPGFTYGLWESSALGFGELAYADPMGEYEAVLTIRFPATEATEMYDAREEWVTAIYIDMSGFNHDGKVKIRSENHGSGEWHTYSYAGRTGEDAYKSFQSNILGTWNYAYTTTHDDDTPFIIHEFQFEIPFIEISENVRVMTAPENETAMYGNIAARFYESYIVGTLREIGTYSYEIGSMEIIAEGSYYNEPEKIHRLQYDPETSLLRYTFDNSDVHHYFTRGNSIG